MTQCLMFDEPMVTPKHVVKRFCGPKCRSRYHSGCSRMGEKMLEAGKITIAEVRDAADHRQEGR